MPAGRAMRPPGRFSSRFQRHQTVQHLVQPAEHGNAVDAFGHALQRFQLFQPQGDGGVVLI